MEVNLHRARIVGPISYPGDNGRMQSIPLGPCLVESPDGQSISIIWGAQGQRSVKLPIEEIKVAANQGHLVLVD